MPKLTIRLVDNLPVKTTDYFCWDSDIPGFGVRIHTSGRKVYVVKYRLLTAAQTKRYTLGLHGVLKTDPARQLAREWLSRVRHGEDPTRERHPRDAPTMAQLAQRYLDEHAIPKKRPKSTQMDTVNLQRHILPLLGTKRVQDVTRQDIALIHTRMQATPGAANRVLALLGTMFTLAEQWDWRPPQSNPVRGLVRYPEHPRTRYLTGEELLRLGVVLAQADHERLILPSIITGVRLLLLTGARLGEVLTLRWKHVDWDRRQVFLPQSKTGPKWLRLSHAAITLLRSLAPVHGNPYVLPGKRTGECLHSPWKSWRVLCQRAQLADVRLHDLRHAYASLGVSLGHGLPIIGAILGHQHSNTTQRYAHAAPDPVHAAVDQIGESMAQALGLG